MIKVNNNIVSNSTLNSGISGASFTYLGEKVYAANKLERIYGVFLSSVIASNENFLKWKEITVNKTIDPYSTIYFFIRTSDSETFVESEWLGPFYNVTTDISYVGGKYIQFMIVLRSDTTSPSVPKVDEVIISYYSSENSVKFFTHAFRIGFQPEHLLLTYNAVETDDTIIRFAVSGVDSVDMADYQFIEPNKLESLSGLTYASNKLKIMAEVIGSSQTQVVLNEFAVMFSGDADYRVNKYEFSTSSESSLSSDSSSSSSSIDSSSSSSSSSSESSSSISSSSSSSVDLSSSSSSLDYSSSSSSSSQSSLSSSSSSSSSSSLDYSSSSSSSSNSSSSSSSASSSSSSVDSSSSSSSNYSPVDHSFTVSGVTTPNVNGKYTYAGLIGSNYYYMSSDNNGTLSIYAGEWNLIYIDGGPQYFASSATVVGCNPNNNKYTVFVGAGVPTVTANFKISVIADGDFSVLSGIYEPTPSAYFGGWAKGLDYFYYSTASTIDAIFTLGCTVVSDSGGYQIESTYSSPGKTGNCVATIIAL